MKHSLRKNRTGSIAVLALFMLIMLVAFAALSVELGKLLKEKSEVQRCADAAAMESCWEYVAQMEAGEDFTIANSVARYSARQSVASNLVGVRNLDIQYNEDNNEEGDIVFGTFSEFGNPDSELVPDNSINANAIKVRVQRTNNLNGEVMFIFANVLGIPSKPLTAEATASFVTNIRGFNDPPPEETLGVMPFAIREDLWDEMIANGTDDDWGFDPDTGDVGYYDDGEVDINIFPHSTGASGNSGTVDIGSNSNGTPELRRQIREGISQSDLDALGKPFALDSNGELELYGDTGVSAGMKDALEDVIGKTRTVMLYRSVSGNGNNAVFTIVRFVGVRVMEVDFTGSKNSNKKLIVQPATVVSNSVIPSSDDTTSERIFSPVILVR